MFQVIQEIVQALNSAKYDDSSLILFSGLGNVFCNGVDLLFLLSGERRVVVRQMVDALRFVYYLSGFRVPDNYSTQCSYFLNFRSLKILFIIRNIQDHFIYFYIYFPDPFVDIIGKLTLGGYFTCIKIQAMS